jgi:peptidyl-tRNA hydrolase, PTH1 family
MESKFKGHHARVKIAGHECHLLIPATFMNLSGQAVGAVAKFYKINPENIIVAHDELDLPSGTVRLKFDGGHGGHNGLRDIIAHLHSPKFHRLRVGIGHPGKGNDVVNYVLQPPRRAEQELIDTAIQNALAVLPEVVTGQIQKAMKELHTF